MQTADRSPQANDAIDIDGVARTKSPEPAKFRRPRMSKAGPQGRAALVLSFALIAMVALSIAGKANSLMLAIFGSAAITSALIHRLFPASSHFILSLVNLISVYASIFAFFAEGCYSGDPFTTLIRESRPGETREVKRDSGHTLPYIGSPLQK